MFGEAVQSVRMNYYPPCLSPDLVLGLSPHSDGSALTVLQQSKNSCVGLQILKDNTCVPILPLPNALVINIGDTIEVLTNGKYKSVEHRAVTNREKERLTIVTFYAPNYEVEIERPMSELIMKPTHASIEATIMVTIVITMSPTSSTERSPLILPRFTINLVLISPHHQPL